MRRAAKVDKSQGPIVQALRQIPGVSVTVGMDDIIVGHKGRTYWYEIKSPDAISRRTGEVNDSEITDSERGRLDNWTGHYRVVWDVAHILEDIGI